MPALLPRLSSLLASGGPVAPPLLACCLLLWLAVGHRLVLLRRGTRQDLDALLAAALAGRPLPRGALGGALTRSLAHQGHAADLLRAEALALGRWAGAITAVVATAPLLGLLGTVHGMIETFDSLADMALFSRGGGIAGGVSQALVSTQMGLVVAIPGAIVGRLLGRKEEALRGELDELARRLPEAQP